MNSALGQAITWLLKHCEKLTLLLLQRGAPLENNIVEQALKMAILHRNNALFYKTLNGGCVGGIFMSLIRHWWINDVESGSMTMGIVDAAVPDGNPGPAGMGIRDQREWESGTSGRIFSTSAYSGRKPAIAVPMENTDKSRFAGPSAMCAESRPQKRPS
ncbi:MAG: IS66 family transposase [Phycisphaerae bacterium]